MQTFKFTTPQTNEKEWLGIVLNSSVAVFWGMEGGALAKATYNHLKG